MYFAIYIIGLICCFVAAAYITAANDRYIPDDDQAMMFWAAIFWPLSGPLFGLMFGGFFVFEMLVDFFENKRESE